MSIKRVLVKPLVGIPTLALLATTAACGIGPSSAPGDDAFGPILVPKQEAYPASIAEGKLELKSECFVVGDAVLLLPEGTDWDATTEELTIDDTVVTVGDPVSLGGGEVPGSLVEDLAGESEREAAEGCLEKQAGAVLFLVSGF